MLFTLAGIVIVLVLLGLSQMPTIPWSAVPLRPRWRRKRPRRPG